MFGVVSVLHRIRHESWVASFVEGLTPAVAVLMLFVAWKIFNSGNAGLGWQSLLIGSLSLAALLFNLPAPLVIFAAGLAGVFLFR
jgi:chromate transport protein ChrA